MALNPLAAEFVPNAQRQKKQDYPSYTGWGRDGYSQRKRSSDSFWFNASGTDRSSLPDIPKEIIAMVFQKLQNPADALAAALVNKWLLHNVSEAALKLRVTANQLQPPNHSFLRVAHQTFPGTVELCLSGCSVLEDADVVSAISKLPRLTSLDLSACRKLSPQFVKDALAASHKAALQLADGTAAAQGLKVLGLQRCFQLDANALSDVLKAAASTHSKLAVVTLSHLSLEGWPLNQAASPFPASAEIRQELPRILALHNSRSIAADGLVYLAACCPDLEMLLLGGSSLDVPFRSSEDEEGPEEVQQELLHIGSQVLWGVRNLNGFHKRQAAAIADATRGLSRLRVLELTFHYPKVVSSVASQLPNVQVWDFSQPSSLEAAERVWEEHRRKESASGMALALSAAANCSSPAKHTPLHAAVDSDCKSSIKARLAAGLRNRRGNGKMAAKQSQQTRFEDQDETVLLDLGGQMEAKDNSGATPLFLACETGRLGCASMLIRAGAELRRCNTSGEAPLYIAALRGHDAIVEHLLAAFQERGLKWTESSLYGDRWNPLMAAAVADRHVIAARLLRAAAPEDGSLALATNRYGQTAGHIAARKGSYLMLTALIKAAGSIAAVIPDNDHKTPLQIAQAHKQDAAVALLQRATAAFAEENGHDPRASAGARRRPPPRHGRARGRHSGDRHAPAADDRHVPPLSHC